MELIEVRKISLRAVSAAVHVQVIYIMPFLHFPLCWRLGQFYNISSLLGVPVDDLLTAARVDCSDPVRLGHWATFVASTGSGSHFPSVQKAHKLKNKRKANKLLRDALAGLPGSSSV